MHSSAHLSQHQASDAPSQPSHSEGIYIELQSRADFLRARPEFDTASIIAVPASQLSDYPHPDSESDLPPSQFWVVSSQPSQDATVADSQPLVVESPAAHQSVAIKAPASAVISQTTIPDSQELSNDFSQDIVEVPGTAEGFDQSLQEATSPKPSNKESSGSTIPSHQPNINQVSFAHDLLIVEPEHQLLSQPELEKHPSPPLPPATSGSPVPSRPLSSRNSFGGFLTQPAFEPAEFSLSTESKGRSPPHVPSTVIHQSHTTGNPSLNESHQPAQIVSPLSGQASQFLTQTDVEFFSASEDYEVVPDSSLRTSGQTGQHQQVLLQEPVADTVADSVCVATTFQSQHVS